MRIVRSCRRCGRELTSNSCGFCNIDYGPGNTHPGCGIALFVVVWLGTGWALAVHGWNWLNGIPFPEDKSEALQIAAVVFLALTVITPFSLRALQKSQRAEGETVTTVAHIIGVLVVLGLICYGAWWMLTQS
jgi:hypothetical protein